MSKIACDVVKDIMPLCIDDVCSENSKQLVNEHIIECDKCKKLWDSYSNASITNEIKDDNDIMFQELTSQIKKKKQTKNNLYSNWRSIYLHIYSSNYYVYFTWIVFSWKGKLFNSRY